ncbi:hypothetical protein AB0K09_15705 [Streptomyces sp. NPDC049577]|uniref:hypothetical protein n=1 Tax=Streptomyces sp. NPDC049577 TaxID=3155153 RepID=UPI003418D95D
MNKPEAESTYQVWYCNRCDKACKIQPPTIKPGCRCANPVPGVRPTLVTQMAQMKPRPVQALTEEEARLRSLARKDQRVTVTYEAEVSKAWLRADANGAKRIQFIVTTPDGRRHVVDPSLPGLHVEAAPEGERPVVVVTVIGGLL